MGIIHTNYGEPSYTIHNDLVSVFVTVQAGHLTASFDTGTDETVNPFFMPPWWREAQDQDMDEIINVLRGDFFCFPFGGNEDSYEGKKYPVHGKTANANWDFVSVKEDETGKELTLRMELDYEEGSVEKRIGLHDNERVIYSTHTISGFTGKMPIGHHPTLQLPEREGAGIIDISKPLAGFTPPEQIEDPRMGGYSQLQPKYEITDRSNVLCMNGQSIDLTRYPGPKGFDDIVIFLNDSTREFAYTTLALPDEGYLYFNLKNPKVLASTLFWMANGGRHYVPWNGRVTSAIGMEEITGFYHYGRTPSIDKNFLQEKGYKTSVEIDGKPFDVKLMMGVVPIDQDFQGVEDIVRKDPATISIIGRGGEKIDVACQVDFLRSE